MSFTLLMLEGDGIGPEVSQAALAVLSAVAAGTEFHPTVRHALIGAAALRNGSGPLPDATREAALHADAVFLGAVGDPSADHEPPHRRPEAGLLALRAALGVYANLRPVRMHPALAAASPLRPERLAGTDLLVVRELLGGLYFGTPRGRDETSAYDTMRYTRAEIERIAHVAFRAARTRRHQVLSVDKANVLETSRLWRETVIAVAQEYPEIRLEHGYVDSTAMRLVSDPASVDVLLTENLFGDILSDEAGVLTGSLGVLASASLGDGPGLFEPVHGSAPSLAGRNVANPIGAIASMALLLRYTARQPDLADRIDRALDTLLSEGHCTADLGGTLGTTEFTTLMVRHLHTRADSDV